LPRIRDAAALALALGGATATTPAAAQDRAPFDFPAVLECRARAIAQLQLADFDAVAFGAAETTALREMTDFVIRFGVWGALPGDVDAAVDDMRLGEEFLIANARRVSRFADAWERDGPFDAELTACVDTVWRAAKIVIDRELAR
jgi:hypothetical protein